MDDWSASIVLILFILVLTFLYGVWPQFVWWRLGVSGPTPLPFVGNAIDIARKGLHNSTQEWGKKYGDCYGIVIMREPVLLTSDLEILKEGMVKEHDNFSDRAPDVPLLPSPLHLSLVTAGGRRWKRLRNVVSPSFSAGKLRKMGVFIRRCCKNLVSTIEKSTNEGKPLRLKELFGAYTLDVFAGTGLGLRTNCLEEQENEFINNVDAVLKHSDFVTVPAVLSSMFPFLAPVLRLVGFSVFPVKETCFVANTIHSLIDLRRSTNSHKSSADLLQLLLKAKTDAHPDLTEDEMVAQGIVFFVAGYDTSSTCLQFLAYLLATHPDKQDKLYREITDRLGHFGEGTYKTVSKLQYLDSCIYEALRLFPPVPMFARKARESRTLRGVTIPAGCSLGAPLFSIMRDPQFFHHPDHFIPERFQDTENEIPSLLKNMSFGLGPRRCVGMPLALYEIKMAVVSVLRHFRFVRHEDTPDTIAISANVVCTPTKPLVIGCQPRDVINSTGSRSQGRRWSVDAGVHELLRQTVERGPQKARQRRKSLDPGFHQIHHFQNSIAEEWSRSKGRKGSGSRKGSVDAGLPQIADVMSEETAAGVRASNGKGSLCPEVEHNEEVLSQERSRSWSLDSAVQGKGRRKKRPARGDRRMSVDCGQLRMP